MDDEDFRDLFDEIDLFEDSSQESLTIEAANLDLRSDTYDFEPCASTSQDHDWQETSQLMLDACHTTYDLTPPQSGGNEPNISFTEIATISDLTSAVRPAIQQIEDMFHDLNSDLANGRDEIAVCIKSRKTSSNIAAQASDEHEPTKTRRICFPGKTAEEAWRFTAIVRILELIHEALRTDTVLSKRDIYYRDPALFGTQSVVDRYIDDIALTFNVPRHRLNVSAVAKGLLVGAMTFTTREGATLPSATDKEGSLVPNLKDILCVDMTLIKWIMVIEKEASFRSIANSAFWQHISREGIMITGKGYPDVATRAVLHFLSAPTPRNGFASPPVYALVDFDPDGLAIFSVYKHGSLALEHENEDLTVPHMQWLGLRLEDAKALNEDAHAEQGLLTLTPRDRAKAVKMLERNRSLEDQAQHIEALQRMLMLNVKAELQLLDFGQDGMLNLLKAKLYSTDAGINGEELDKAIE